MLLRTVSGYAVKTTDNPPTNVGTVWHDFGCTDAKGRALGTRIATYEVEYVALPADASSYSTVPVGSYFVFAVHATRDGKPFGAFQYPRRFATALERDAAAAKYLANARKAAAKKGS
jgi:hypothetical protein